MSCPYRVCIFWTQTRHDPITNRVQKPKPNTTHLIVVLPRHDPLRPIYNRVLMGRVDPLTTHLLIRYLRVLKPIYDPYTTYLKFKPIYDPYQTHLRPKL